MDSHKDPSTSGQVPAATVVHYHVYNINQATNVQIGDNNIINNTVYDDDEDSVDAVDYTPQPLEESTSSPNVHNSPPPAQQPPPISSSVKTEAVMNPNPLTQNNGCLKPQCSPPPSCAPSYISANNGSSGKPHASPPKLNPSLHLGKMPFSVRHKLTSMLSVKKPDGKDWRLLVEKLGFEPHYVALWDQRKQNPAETLLQSWQVQLGATVGRLHALLVECDMGDIAQVL